MADMESLVREIEEEERNSISEATAASGQPCSCLRERVWDVVCL